MTRIRLTVDLNDSGLGPEAAVAAFRGALRALADGGFEVVDYGPAKIDLGEPREIRPTCLTDECDEPSTDGWGGFCSGCGVGFARRARGSS